MATQLINVKDFKEFIANGRGIILLTTTWCQSAVMMGVYFDKFSEKYKNSLKFGKIDVDNLQEIIEFEKVGAIPEFLIYKDGKLDSRQHCVRFIDLEEFISKFVERMEVLDKRIKEIY